MKKKAPAKRAKSKVRITDPKAAIDAHVKLEAMPLTERIAAVADDVHSKRDEYRSIDRHELARLLGINARQPGGDGWNFVGFVPRVSVRDILLECDKEEIPELIETHVTAKRLKEIGARIELLKQRETKLRRTSLDFLTEKEKRTIERLYMEREAETNGPMWVIAYYTIKVPHRKQIVFEALIEDDGGCIRPLTPYDDRDGKFSDLSDCLIVP